MSDGKYSGRLTKDVAQRLYMPYRKLQLRGGTTLADARRKKKQPLRGSEEAVQKRKARHARQTITRVRLRLRCPAPRQYTSCTVRSVPACVAAGTSRSSRGARRSCRADDPARLRRRSGSRVRRRLPRRACAAPQYLEKQTPRSTRS